MNKPNLYIHCLQANHFIKWELGEFTKYFNLVDTPSAETILMGFGPDVLEAGLQIPAKKRFIVLFPGFGHNPFHDKKRRESHRKIIQRYDGAFINPGPLEVAYSGLSNIHLYPFSVDDKLIGFKKYRKKINSLVHVSSPSPQKDWERSEQIMKNTGLRYNVFPPRDNTALTERVKLNETKNRARVILGLKPKDYLPYGYFSHKETIAQYNSHDGFVHVAKDIKDPLYIDGKYTASFIEAGLTGAILFWHDTYQTKNTLKTVFELPLDPVKAAQIILDIRSSIDVYEHSRRTRQEMLNTFGLNESVRIRAEVMLRSILV